MAATLLPVHTESEASDGATAAAAPLVDWPAALVEHARWLRAVVWARVRESAAVEEVMQEVALAAIAQRAPLTDAARVGPWLYQVAVRQSLLYRRRRGRSRRLHARYAALDGPGRVPEHNPLAWLLLDEQRALVRTALTELPARDASILLLKYGEGWSYQEIAVHLGVGHSAVEARLHRARRRLRSILTEQDRD